MDCCSSLDNLIEPQSVFVNDKSRSKQPTAEESEAAQHIRRFESKGYMDSYMNPKHYIEEQEQKARDQREKDRRFPSSPQRDVLKFLIDFAPLENWEREILSIVRSEAYYFAPQAQTKIMNEGWASYWHAKIMTNHILKDSEVVDFADHHAGTLATQPGRLNPYKLGIELFRDIEDRWNRGKFGKEYDECEDIGAKKKWDRKLGLGQQKIFEVRKSHNDVTFVDEFLTEEFAIAQKLFTYGYNRRTGQYEIVDRDWRKVKQQLLFSLTNHGQPIIRVTDGNFENRSELLLEHTHEGMDLNYEMAVETLRNLHRLWKRPVNIVTKYNSQAKLLSFDGKEFKERDA